MKRKATTKGYAFSIGILFLLTANIGIAQNYFAGTGAGSGNTGNYCSGVGYYALGTANSGTHSAAFGNNSLRKNTSGFSNTALGSTALYNNLGGSENTASGASALYNNTSGSYNAAYGNSALFNNTIGDNNIAIGYKSAFYNTTGSSNIAIGELALLNNNSGSANIAIGASALKLNYNGLHNIAVGSYAASANETGNYNAAFGAYSFVTNQTGSNNCSYGFNSMYKNYTGSSNTSIGSGSLYNSSGGNYNVAVGASSGNSFANYTRCTFLGYSTDASVSGLSNATAIGNAATVDASNKVVIGNTAVTSIGGWANWTNLSDRRLKSNINKSELGLGFILSLNPVTYYYTAEGQKNILQTGLIAQEVDEAAKKQGVDFSAVDKSGEYWGLRYATLTVPLIKAIQEMEANHMAEKEMLNNRIEKLEAAIASLQQKQFPETKSVSLQSILFQNQPNPFNQSAVIRYSLKAGDEKAAIVIRDLNGKVIKQFAVASSANSYITVSGNELAPGTYTYTLIINGMAADTKLMVIAK